MEELNARGYCYFRVNKDSRVQKVSLYEMNAVKTTENKSLKSTHKNKWSLGLFPWSRYTAGLVQVFLALVQGFSLVLAVDSCVVCGISRTRL